MHVYHHQGLKEKKLFLTIETFTNKCLLVLFWKIEYIKSLKTSKYPFNRNYPTLNKLTSKSGTCGELSLHNPFHLIFLLLHLYLMLL